MDTERFKPNPDALAEDLVPESQEPTEHELINIEGEAELILDELLEELTSQPEPKAKGGKRKNKQDSSEISKCIHHWIVETPVDGISHGICKICSAEKGFDHNKAFGGTWDKISRRKYEDAQRKNRDEKGRYIL